MTVFPSFLVAASFLLLPASNAFTVPRCRSTTPSSSSLFMIPDGSEDWMLRDPQEYNSKPNPPRRRKPIEEPILQRQKQNSEDEYYTDNPNLYRPANRFDQNDSFITSPYGQANDIRRPSGVAPKPGARLERANIDEYKAEQSEQDAFIHGAYGSGGPGRYGFDINGPRSTSFGRRRGRQEAKARSQQNFIDGPYGSRGAPGYPPIEEQQRPKERASGRGKPSNHDPQAEFRNAPYGNRNGPNGVEIGGSKYERYRPQKPAPQEEMSDRYERYIKPEHEQQGGSAPRSRLERFDPARDLERHHNEPYNQVDPRANRDPRARGPPQQDEYFDSDRYERPRDAPREEDRYSRVAQQQQQWGQSERDDFIYNSNGANYNPYGNPTGGNGYSGGW